MTRQTTYIEKEDFIKIYPEGVNGLRTDLQKSAKTIKTPKNIEVDIVSSLGPYEIVRSKHQENSTGNFIIPKELVKTGSVPDYKEIFTPLLEKYHPNNWMIYNDGIYINYPKLEITNSLGIRHTIYDLLVRILIRTTGGQFMHDEFRGTRLSLTNKERAKGYRHSHLTTSSSNEIVLTRFCLGSGHFANIINEFYNKTVVTAEEFETFLIALKAYVEWESIEGKPHISIRTLSEFTTEISRHRPPPYQQVATQLLLQEILLQEAPETFFNTYGKLITKSHEAFLKIEEKVATELETTGQCSDTDIVYWDKVTCQYVQLQQVSEGGYSPPRVVTEDIQKFIELNKITPRMIEDEQVSQPTCFIKRLHPNYLANILNNINGELLNLTHRNIKQNAKRIIRQTEAESNNEQGVDLSSSSIAQTVSEGQGVERAVSI